jgi:hypothetical protein
MAWDDAITEIDWLTPEKWNEAVTRIKNFVAGSKCYTLQVMAASQGTVADGATYYFGSLAGLAPQTTANRSPLPIPLTGTIKRASIVWRASTAGTGENISAYIRVNNTTDYLIATVGNTAAVKDFTNAAMSVPVAAGNTIEIKLVCPTWATNPATLALGGVIYIDT